MLTKYVALIALGVGAALGASSGYIAGKHMQAVADLPLIAKAAKDADARAAAAEAERDAQAAEHKKELAARDKRDELAKQLNDDARDHIQQTEARLAEARAKIKELSRDKQVDSILRTRVPDSVRRVYCDQLGDKTCGNTVR